jgi:hypothetical protein
MTASDVITAARDLYNATGDTFFADTLMYNWLWQGCNQLAVQTLLIENVYSTTTVASQQTYAFPTLTHAIKRVTYNGIKLKPVTMRQDDAITLTNSATTATGTPSYYYTFNFTLYLRPIPDTAYTLQIYSFNLHSQITTANQNLELPLQFQMDTVDYLLSMMQAKDEKYDGALYYRNLWKDHILEAKRWKAKQKRTDAFAVVENEDILPVTILGGT